MDWLVAQKRLERGLHLNLSEAITLLNHEITEWARDDLYNVEELQEKGRTVLRKDQVLAHVPELAKRSPTVVIADFKTGTHPVAIHDPFV